MNQVARVFIILNFVLSVVYLAVAATLLSQQWDYRELYLSQKQESEENIKNLSDKNQLLEVQFNNLRSVSADLRKTTKDFQDKYQKIQEANNQLTRENQDFKTSVNRISADVKEINAKLAEKDNRIIELDKTIENQKQAMEEAAKAKEEAQNEQQRLEIQLSNVQGELTEKDKLLQRSQKELVEAKQILRTLSDSGVNVRSLVKRAKPMDGRIVAVSDQVPIVMLSLGSDSGVEKGNQFTVFRGNQYVGQVTVEEVYKDMCAARVVKDMTVKAIQKGDNVTTRIGGGNS